MILEQEKSESSKLSYFPYFHFEGIQKKKKERKVGEGRRDAAVPRRQIRCLRNVPQDASMCL